jgi:hypothetical protein
MLLSHCHDFAKIEAGVRALNLGEVHQIDADGNMVKQGPAGHACPAFLILFLPS